MEKKTETTDVLEPILKATDTKEFLMSAVGQEIKKFELMQRKAQVYNCSSIVPKEYRGKENLGNVIIGLDMAERMCSNPLTVFQNLYVVYGNPSWSAKFLIASFNQCGRYAPLRYEETGKQGTDSWGMRAYSYDITDVEHKAPLYGPWVTIQMAKQEGWYSKSGSKWQTIPGLMLRYRAAAWFINTTAPEISMGLRTAEEEEDTHIVQDADYEEIVPHRRVSFDKETGEVKDIPAENAPEQEPKPKEGPEPEPQTETKKAPQENDAARSRSKRLQEMFDDKD